MRWARAIAFAGWILVAEAGPDPALAQEAGGAAALASRYTDEPNGFSLRPPAGTERERKTSPRQLARWARRDEKTKAIRWRLEVLRVRQEPSKLPLGKYAEAVAAELTKTARFKVEPTRVEPVAGKPAMHFRGLSEQRLKLWIRQTWVQVEPGHFLVLSMAGALPSKAEMDAVLTAVAESLELFDPKAAQAKRRELLARGAQALGKGSQAAMTALLAEEPYYFDLQLKGKTIGFVKVTETATRKWNADGVLVVRLGAVQLPGQPRRLTREELFATADRVFERWRRTVTDGSGPKAATTVWEAIKQENVLVLQTPGRTPAERTRRIPRAIAAAYLPQAFDVLVARLIQRARPGAYGFAVHNATANDFDLRTLTVVGAEDITVDGRTVQAVHLRDQTAANAPPADVWVGPKGLPLRMHSAAGVTMERCRRKAVAARFAAELRELEKTGR